MSLLSGLEKFGIQVQEDVEIFEDEKKARDAKAAAGAGAQEKELQEEDFLLDKKTKCPLCETEFVAKTVKTGRLKRLDSDPDLRPRYKEIDTIKYDVYACPKCGYAAMAKYFTALPSTQAKLIQENISKNYKPNQAELEATSYTYDMAIDRFKLALMNCIVKKGKASEKAFLCLKLGWALRGKAETLPKDTPDYDKAIAALQEEESECLANAYGGFEKAVSTEDFPICGMDPATLDFLLAVLAMKCKRFDAASRNVSRLLTNKSCPPRIKDKAHDLKEQIQAEMKKAEKK